MTLTITATGALTNSDMERLRGFRISDDLIQLHQIRRVTSAEARDFGIRYHGNLSGVLFEIFGADGESKGGSVRRDTPEMENGKPKSKYVHSKGHGHLYFERSSRKHIADSNVPAIFVEAYTSALAIAAVCQRTGRQCLVIALSGCWGWRGTIGRVPNESGERVDEKGPLGDLDHILFKGRPTIIMLDTNVTSNTDVQIAESAFKRELQKRGAVVSLARIPKESAINGPDDFLAAHDDEEFLRILDQALAAGAGDDSVDAKDQKSKTDRLVELAQCCEFFHQDVDESFASFTVAQRVEIWPIKSNGFRQWLSHEFWNRYKSAPGSQALQDALNVLCGQANYDGKQATVHTRVAEHNGNLYLDLVDDQWRAVEITPRGWNIIKEVPVKFVRTRGMLEIPAPVAPGNLNLLRQFLNVQNDGDFAQIKAFLVATLKPNLPFPVLALTGEQGTGKSSLCRKLKSLVDPGRAPVRGLPRELRDLAIAAANGWLLGFDNVSTIPVWISDALCSLSTGGGFATRELYSDDSERLFDYQRPVILNGIGDIVTRPDLLDRCIVLELPIIPEDKRRQESELNRQFESARPQILGGLLDAAVSALKNLSTVKLPQLPRMADFATWAVAAEREQGTEAVFLNAYTNNRLNLNQVALDSSIIGPPILQLLNDQSQWDGLLAELLRSLTANVPDSVAKSKSWPSSSRLLKSELTRVAPNLRQLGIDVTFLKRTNRGIPITLERTGKLSSPSTLSAPPNSFSDLGDGTHDDGADVINTFPHSSSQNGNRNSVNSLDSDDGDESVDDLQRQSCEKPVTTGFGNYRGLAQTKPREVL